MPLLLAITILAILQYNSAYPIYNSAYFFRIFTIIYIIFRRIRAAKEDLLQSDYYKHFFNTLKESLSVIDRKEVVEIISFGLGHIGDCTISRYQLALILCLRDHFRVDCHVHDPIFYSNECQVLETLNFKLINENEEGRRTLRNDGITIVYLPHCPKQLTNNFLWNNWTTNLKNCVLIGNSFLRLIESQPHENLNISAPYILNIQPYTEEFSLVNSFKFNDVFNDTSIHVFPARTLSLITDNFWYRGESEPDYSNNVEFISSSIISRLRTGDPFEHGYI